MAYTLTTALRTRLQRKLSIDATESVWTNDELDDIYDEAEGNFDRTLVIALRELMIGAARFNDYTAGQTSEKKSQVFQQLKSALQDYEEMVQRAGNQVAIVGMRRVPPVYKEVPAGEEQPDVKNRRHNLFLRDESGDLD